MDKVSSLQKAEHAKCDMTEEAMKLRKGRFFGSGYEQGGNSDDVGRSNLLGVFNVHEGK
jgi:hypothetical protein